MAHQTDIEKKILDFFNNVKSPKQIVATILYDPGCGKPFTRAIGIKISLALKILVERKKLGGKFTSINQIAGIKGLGKDTLRNIYFSFGTNKTVYPVALFPVRLETRFKNSELWVRIYPDDICIDSHDKRITSEESNAIDRLKIVINDTGININDKRAYWRNFVTKYGLPRATYLAILEEKLLKDDEFFSPRVRVLPSRFCVTVYKNGEPRYYKLGRTIPDELPLLRTSNSISAEDTFFDESSRWVSDFTSAEAIGMAMKIPLKGDEGPFDRVVAVGINEKISPHTAAQRIEGLVESHVFTKGIGFLKYGTPTNNTNKTAAGYSQEMNNETEDSYDLVFSARSQAIIPNSNADIFSHLMGITPSIVSGIEFAQDKQEYYSSHMRNAIWPGLGDYYLSSMLSSSITKDDRWQLWDHFKNYVYGRGYCPSIRIGKQPYGILPARSQNRWSVSSRDGFDNDSSASDPVGFDNKLNRIIQHLFNRYWLTMSESENVPNIGSPADLDQELTGILAMSPHSLSYHGRAFIDDRFVAFLLNALGLYFFGQNSGFDTASPEAVEYWTSRWATQWKDIENPPDQVLKEIASAIGLNDDALIGPALSNLFSWGDGRSINTNMVLDENAESPLSYLDEFAQVPDNLPDANVNKPVLYELLRRSLAYQRTHDEQKRLVPPDTELQTILFKEHNAIGSVAQILVPVNRKFNKGDILLKIHCEISIGPRPPNIRMHNVIAPEDGIVEELLVEIGASVKPHAELMLYKSTNATEARICQSIDTLCNEAIDEQFLEGHLLDSLDLLTHRIDAWVTSFANKRLLGMRKKNPDGIHIGAYGYVENLSKNDQSTGDIMQGNPGGYVHAPSVGQAATAALMRNAYLTHLNDINGNAYRINISSQRVRRAMRIIQGLREGQELPELLGYQLERELHDKNLDLLIDEFRTIYPLVAEKEIPIDSSEESEESVEAIAARNVADGLTLARNHSETENWAPVISKLEGVFDKTFQSLLEEHFDNAPEKEEDLLDILNNLRDSLDAMNDTLIHESVFHAVQGNYERSGAALEAMNGLNRPPELESIKTPTAAVNFGHRVCMLFESTAELSESDFQYPRRCAEPRLDKWLGDNLGAFDQIGCMVKFENDLDDMIVTFAELDLCALDLLSITADETKKSETDLDRYIKYYIRNIPDDVDRVISSIEYNRSSQHYQRSMGEVLELLRTIRKVISVEKKYLSPCALSRPEGQPDENGNDTFVEDLFTNDDYLEIRGRIDRVYELFTDKLNVVKANASYVPENYFNLSRFRIIEALPDIPPETEDQSNEFNQSIIEQGDKIINKANAALSEVDGFIALETPDYNKAIKRLCDTARILLGENFVMLPSCTPTNGSELSPAFSNSEDLIHQDTENITIWLQQAAEVKSRLRQMEDMLLTTAAWKTAWVNNETDYEDELVEIPDQSDYQLHVAQLPHGACNKWLALPDEEHDFSGLEERHRGITSFVCYSGINSFSALQQNDYSDTRISGLIIDAWEEKIPQFGQENSEGNRELPTQQTGISFQYDRPNAQAPQSIILAVPNAIDKEGAWKLESLREIVCETMDLAKARAVDLDAFSQIGGIMPGLYIPVDENTPGWVRDVVVSSLEDLIVPPSPCADFQSYIAGTGLGPKFDDELRMQLVSLGTSPALKRLYGSCFVFEPEGIRLTWSPDARGELLITISQISGLRSEPVPEINAYNASGGVVGSGFTEGFSGWKRFRVDLDRAERIDITGGYHDPSKNYVYCLSSICVIDPEPPSPIEEGAVFNSYLVKSIFLHGAPDGEYTFRQYDSIDNPEHLFYVHLLHNGTEVMQLAYNWQTTISFDDPYRFSFPGYFDIDIAKAYSGTQNLHGLKNSLFDGQQYLTVEPL